MYTISNETGDMVRLTSYHSLRGRERLLCITKIQETGQATSAALSFFDPITINDFKESFIDGAVKANNLVYKVQNKAQDIQLSSSLKDKIKCLVSIRTGILSLTPFKDNVISISQSVKAQSKEQNLLVASELEFQDKDQKKVKERTRLYTWR